MNGPHDCGPRAIKKACPEIPDEKIMNAFKKVYTRLWPNGGVYSDEFEEVMKELSIKFNRVFRYTEKKVVLSRAVKKKPGTYIFQSPSYFAVNLDESQAKFSDQKVYIVWEIIK